MSHVLENIASQPIGIFDSGIGGLTVARAVVDRLPQENLIYFGDTAHLPYGEKSVAALQAYSIKITDFLLQKKCKLIVIACNSASSAAYELVKEYVGEKAFVINAIDPLISELKTQYANQCIGLIGTRQTINSGIYQKKITAKKCGIQLISHTTNLLASAIEEFGSHAVIDELLRVYLSHPNFKKIKSLILACTHYPIIKEKVAHYFNNTVHVIDPSDSIANAVAHCLEKNNALNKKGKSKKIFYVSDYTDGFAKGTTLFFKEKIQLKPYPLWE